MVLCALLIETYAWMNFKPKGLNTQHYTYHTNNYEYVPDSHRAILLWGRGRYVNKETLAEGEEPGEPSPEYWEKNRKEYEEV